MKKGKSKTETTGKRSAAPEKKTEPQRSFRVANEPVVTGAAVEENAHKYEATTEHYVSPAYEDLGPLPASYGTNTIFLVARDPQWLFTYWEIDQTKGADGKVLLKVYDADGGLESTVQVNPEASNWYLPVNRAGSEYYVEIGYTDASGSWQTLATSNRAATPSSSIAAEDPGSVDFATVPMHLTFHRLLDMVKDAMQGGETLLAAIAKLQGEGRKLNFQGGKAPDWSDDQKRVLAALLGDEVVEKLSLGSEEIDRLLRRQLSERLNTESASGLAMKGRFEELFGPGVSSLFSGVGASWSAQPFSKPERGFFMHVNAEVIFYGGTHPDAKVTIDGNPVQLQPDGSFRYHFKFPDGDFNIPIVAVSPDGVETRSATLAFERGTERVGDVGHTAQPKDLPSEPMGRR